MSPADLAELAAGATLAALGVIDLFVTMFNYDGFTFIAGRFQRYLWGALRSTCTVLPGRARHAALSMSSAALLPSTVALWLALETVGFGLMYGAGLAAGGFAATHGAGRGLGGAFYLSAGAITTLSFGDVIATHAAWRALVDLESMVGLATFTLSLGYMVTTFGVLNDLDRLHNTVRHHAPDPGRPSSVLARHYRGGAPDELPDLLQGLSTSLESYDEGLRRYPVAYYFHTRRTARSVPRVFWTLGELLALIRWGLPEQDPMVEDPWLSALLEQYATTVRRLQRSFVGPVPLSDADGVSEADFARGYGSGRSEEVSVSGFISTQSRARAATGMAPPPDPDRDAAFRRYSEWLQFVHLRDVVLRRLTDRLGYDLEAVAGAGAVGQ